MKKIVVSLLCGMMLLNLVGCGAKTESAVTPETQPAPSVEATVEPSTEATVEPSTEAPSTEVNSGDTLGNQLVALFEEGIAAGKDMETLANELAEKSDMGCIVVPAQEGFLTGFSKDVKGFTTGMQFSPMIGSIPFVGYIFETDDAEGLKDNLLSLADPRWNICTEAQEKVCVTSGDYVFFAMCP